MTNNLLPRFKSYTQSLVILAITITGLNSTLRPPNEWLFLTGIALAITAIFVYGIYVGLSLTSARPD